MFPRTLSEKSSKGLVYLYSQKIWPVNIYIKSFETVIKPIMLYGCETWGQHMVNRKDSCMLNMPKFDLALRCERLHIKMCTKKGY